MRAAGEAWFCECLFRVYTHTCAGTGLGGGTCDRGLWPVPLPTVLNGHNLLSDAATTTGPPCFLPQDAVSLSPALAVWVPLLFSAQWYCSRGVGPSAYLFLFSWKVLLLPPLPQMFPSSWAPGNQSPKAVLSLGAAPDTEQWGSALEKGELCWGSGDGMHNIKECVTGDDLGPASGPSPRAGLGEDLVSPGDPRWGNHTAPSRGLA